MLCIDTLSLFKSHSVFEKGWRMDDWWRKNVGHFVEQDFYAKLRSKQKHKQLANTLMDSFAQRQFSKEETTPPPRLLLSHPYALNVNSSPMTSLPVIHLKQIWIHHREQWPTADMTYSTFRENMHHSRMNIVFSLGNHDCDRTSLILFDLLYFRIKKNKLNTKD